MCVLPLWQDLIRRCMERDVDKRPCVFYAFPAFREAHGFWSTAASLAMPGRLQANAVSIPVACPKGLTTGSCVTWGVLVGRM